MQLKIGDNVRILPNALWIFDLIDPWNVCVEMEDQQNKIGNIVRLDLNRKLGDMYLVDIHGYAYWWYRECLIKVEEQHDKKNKVHSAQQDTSRRHK